MKYDFQYQSGARSFDADFGRVINATDGGFERGYTQGYTEGETAGTAKVEASNAIILSDCNAVLPDKGVETADSLEQVPQRIGEIKPEPDWVQYITRPEHLFDGAIFPDGFSLDITTDSVYQCIVGYAKGISHVKLRAKDKTKPINLYQAFTNVPTLKTVDLSETSCIVQYTTMVHIFLNDTRLEEIIGNLDFSKVDSDISSFASTNALREIRIVPSTIKFGFSISSSSKLSDASIQSIIDGLADLTGQAAKTLTLHATVGAKMTEAQKETIAAKNWTLVY